MEPAEDTAQASVRQRMKNPKTDQQNGNESDHIKDITEWKRHIEGMKTEIVEDMSCHLRMLIDKTMTEVVQTYSMKSKTASSEVQQGHNGAVSEGRNKVFRHRASLLDDLMEVEHFRTIYHMFVAALCVFIISTTAVGLIDHGRLFWDFDLLAFAFGQPGTVIWSWLCLFTYTLLVPYKVLTYWGSLYPESNHKILLSVSLGTFLLVSEICVLVIFPFYVVRHYHLPPASSFIVVLEQFRFIMKSYSFLRETVPRIIATKKETQLPQLSNYLYFLFCPTLIYRDSYPRTPSIRWNYVVKYFAQFLGCVFFLNFVFGTLCIPVFKNISKEPFHTKTLILSIFHATLPGIFVMLISFFAFMHCWMNAFAEMLRFADRMFYKDWWNSTSFSNYYRTWNVIIHDWLYQYMYQDLLWFINKRWRSGIMLCVFLLSAAVHEYALTMSLGYFYPVMFCQFSIFGVIFNFAINDKRTNPVWNVMMWIFLYIGHGIMVCLYFQEWYAQIHCPITEKTFWGLITPRSWSCGM